MACRRLVTLVLALPCACTEPNPSAADTSTSAGDSTSGTADPTSASANATSGNDDDPMSATATDTDPTTTTATDEGTTGAAGCPIGTHVCVAAPPDGWSGPAAIIDDTPADPDPSCAAPYTAPHAVGYDALDPPPADCGCSCTGPTGAACSDLELVRDNNAGCGSPSATWQLDSLACDSAPEGAANQYWQATSGGLDTGTCTPQPTESIAEATFGERHTLCGARGEDAGACTDGDVCAPIPVAPHAEQLCIWQDGDERCPAGLGYDARRVLYRAIADTRSCSQCQCSLEGECNGVVYLLGSDGCGGALAAGTVVIDGACVQVAGGVVYVDVSDYVVDASCDASGGEPQGAATGAEPLTVCCRA